MRTATSARMAPSTFTQLLSSVCVRRNHMRFMRAAAEDGGPGCSSQVLRPVKPRRTDTTRTTDVKVGGASQPGRGEPVSQVGGSQSARSGGASQPGRGEPVSQCKAACVFATYSFKGYGEASHKDSVQRTNC